METSLMSVEEARNIYNMRIEGIVLNDYWTESDVESSFDVQTLTGDVTPAMFKLYKVDEDRVRGYMPSKILYDPMLDSLVCTFYCNDTLPDRVRPFGTDAMYIAEYTPSSVTDTLMYNIEYRLFVDQVMTPSGIKYVFVFGQQTYEQVFGTNV